MFSKLSKLAFWLNQQGFPKEAQAIQDLSEPEEYAELWHEEATTEFGANPITEDEYAEENFGAGVDDLVSFEKEVNETDAEILKLIAQKEGVQILQTGSSLLGAGVYGKVIRGVYQGKPVAAKIIFDNKLEFSKEAENWKKILIAAKTLPPDLKKHIPMIYKINKDEIFYQNINLNYEIIVMEELFPLNGELKRLFKHQDYKPHSEQLLKDEEYLYKISLAISDYVIKVSSRLGLNIKTLDPTKLMKVLLNLGRIKYYDAEKIIKVVVNYLGKTYDLYGVNEKGRKIPFIKSDSGLDLYDGLYDVVSKFFRPDGMPKFQGDPTQFWEDLPETSSFYQTLKTLSSNYGIKWGDVHHENVMMDANGNLKIIDAGKYNTFRFVPDQTPTL